MHNFPFLNLAQMLVVMRVSLAGMMMAHAAVRVINGTVPQFGGFLEARGFPLGVVLVWMITAFELVGGMLFALGYFTRLLAAGFIVILTVGIAIIHVKLGWFVGEHGSGGSEYSVILIVGFLLVAAAAARKSK
jgi:putative oxidoreductase